MNSYLFSNFWAYHNNMEQNSSVQSGPLLQLVDIIFGVIIGATLVTLVPQLVPIRLHLFETWAIYVAFLITLLSWVFYHKAVLEHGLKIDRLIIIDLSLLFLYFYILFSFNNYPHYVLSVCVVFGLYLIWTIVRDYMKKEKTQSLYEYYRSDKVNKAKLKLCRSIGIFAASVILLFLHNHFTTPNYSVVTAGGDVFDWVSLFFITILAIAYRVIPYMK